jgi:hypothetical protein
MLNLLVPGLRAHEHPSYGGWGGRYTRTDDGLDTWGLVDAAFRPGGAEWASAAPSGGEGSVTRWFADAQADFAARLVWSVTPDFAGANHHPGLEIAEGIDVRVSPGESVTLNARVSDPDGDGVSVSWQVLEDAGTCTGELAAVPASGPATRVTVPPHARPGDTVHVLAEAVDDAAAPLKTYRRVILTVV